MKTKKLFKSLLSLALAVILTASVCVCGIAASADETADITVNIHNGTTTPGYLGGGNQLTAKAGISGILEGKSVVRLTPQYAYTDNYKQISIGQRTLAEGEVDYTAVKTLSLFVKNDLGDKIQLYMLDYDNSTYTASRFSQNTIYWLVDTAKNTVKKYALPLDRFVTLPKDFEGYIIYDLTTCDATELEAFLNCNFENTKFRLKGFTEATVGNPLYYGDINISTASADTLAASLAPTAISEYITLDPAAATTTQYKVNGVSKEKEVIDGGEILGNAYKFTVAEEDADSGFFFRPDLFTASEELLDKKALVYRIKASNGVFSERSLTIRVGGQNSNFIISTYTTVNTLTGEIATTENTDSVRIADKEFEGYIIVDLVGAKLGSSTSNVDWNTFINSKLGTAVPAVYKSNTSSTAGLLNDFVFGEVSFVDDKDAFLNSVIPNEKVVLNPATATTTQFKVDGTAHAIEVIDGGEVLGNAYKFTVAEEDADLGFFFRPDLFTASEELLSREALVYRIKASNGVFSERSLTIRVGGQNSNFIISTYTTVNTLTGEVVTTENTDSVRIAEEEFEGYIIVDLVNAKLGSSTSNVDWNTFINSKLGTAVPAVYKSNTSSTAGLLNDFVFGEVTVVNDVEEFMAEILPEEPEVIVDTNETVILDPATATTTQFKVGGTAHAIEVIDGGEVLGNAYKFTVAEEDVDKGFFFRPDLFTASKELLNKEALIYRIKASNGVFSERSLTIRVGGTGSNYLISTYTTVNTLTGEIVTTEEASDSITIAADEFEGYVIIDLTAAKLGSSTNNVDWNTYINSKLGTAVPAVYQTKTGSTAGIFNDFVFGEVSVVNDVDAFIEKVTAPTVEGDANKDGVADIRDLVCMKKSIAGVNPASINGFNVKFANKGKAMDGSDLTIIRKMLLGVEGWKPVYDGIGMAVWGLSDFSEWDEAYGEEYGYAKDIFNYANASSIEDMRTSGADSWLKITNPFSDTTATEMKESYLTELDNRIGGLKLAGVWDNVVGFFSEEIRGKVTDEQYKIFTEYLTEKYPGKRIMAVLSVEEVKGTTAYYADRNEEIPADQNIIITPANYDTYQYTTDIAYDIYTTVDPAKYESLNATLNANLGELDYKKWYMPKACYAVSQESSTEEFMIEHLNLLYKLLKAEANPGGLWLYGWNTYLDENNEGIVGLVDISTKGDYSKLLARIAEIGKEIKAMN